MGKITKFWLPALLWMLVIFTASADANSSRHSSTLFEPLVRWLFPRLLPEQVEHIHFIFRKCAHLTEYAILALLFWRTIRQPQKQLRRPWVWPEAGLALALVFLFAAGDELHQVFVPTRTAEVSDVFIDTAGGAAGLLVLWLMGKIFKRW